MLTCNKPGPYHGNYKFDTNATIELTKAQAEGLKTNLHHYRIELGKDGYANRHYMYKLHLNKRGYGTSGANVSEDMSAFPLLQAIIQTENGSYGSDAPWFKHPDITKATLSLTSLPVVPYLRSKIGHRMLWIEETPQNDAPDQADLTSSIGSYSAPYIDYNLFANHNIRAGWHVRCPVEYTYRTSAIGGRYIHGITIDDPYGWKWNDASTNPVFYGGKNHASPFGRASSMGSSLEVPLLDLPSKEAPLLSLGALQHLPMSQLMWHPTNAFGNGFADPRVPRQLTSNYIDYTSWRNLGVLGHSKNWSMGMQFYAKGAESNAMAKNDTFIYDLSYEANHALWDRYFISDLHKGSTISRNKRLLIDTDLPEAAQAELFDFHRSAKHIYINGAFNVNSTSEAAWASFLASMRDKDDFKQTARDGSQIIANDIYSRFLLPKKINYDDGDPTPEKMWQGYRQLTDDQIKALAKEIVVEVKRRGPFLSVSDFVNRRLVTPPKSTGLSNETDYTKTGLKGTIQAAIDRTEINAGHNKEPMLIEKKEYGTSGPSEQASYHGTYPHADLGRLSSGDRIWGVKPIHYHFADSKLTGAPSYLTQADILQKNGAILTARSDTFTIRAYGDSTDSSGKIVARAWCEAIVQRTVKPINPDEFGIDPKVTIPISPESELGRKFDIILFRWLSKNDI